MAQRRTAERRARWSRWLLGLAVALLGAVCAVIVAVAWIPARSSNPSVDVALALVAATAVVAVAGRRAAVIGAAAGSAFGFTFFDTEPYEHLTITHGSDVATAVLLVVVGLVTGELALRVVRQRRFDSGAGGDLCRVRDAADRLAHGEELVMMIGAVADQITTVLGAAACSFSTEEDDAGLRYIDRDGTLRVPAPTGGHLQPAAAGDAAGAGRPPGPQPGRGGRALRDPAPSRVGHDALGHDPGAPAGGADPGRPGRGRSGRPSAPDHSGHRPGCAPDHAVRTPAPGGALTTGSPGGGPPVAG